MAPADAFGKLVPSQQLLAAKIGKYLQHGGPGWDDILIHRAASGEYTVALQCENFERVLKAHLRSAYDAFVYALQYKQDFLDELCAADCGRCQGVSAKLICGLRAARFLTHEIDYLIAQGKSSPGDTHFFTRNKL